MTHHPPNPDEAAAPSTGPGQALRTQAAAALATRTQEIEAVQAVAAEITQELDLDRLLGLILQRAAELVGVQAGSIHLWEDTTQRLVGRVWRAQGAWVDVPPLPLGAAVVRAT